MLESKLWFSISSKNFRYWFGKRNLVPYQPAPHHPHYQGSATDSAGQENQHDNPQLTFALVTRQMGEQPPAHIFRKIVCHIRFSDCSTNPRHPQRPGLNHLFRKQGLCHKIGKENCLLDKPLCRRPDAEQMTMPVPKTGRSEASRGWIRRREFYFSRGILRRASV